MNRTYAVFAALIPGMLISTSPAIAGETPAPAPQIVKSSTLPTIGLTEFQEALFPGANYVPIPTPPDGAEADRKVNLGGIGSDLFRAHGTSTNEFYVITDRGPNGEADVAGTTRRPFPVALDDDTLLVLERTERREDLSRGARRSDEYPRKVGLHRRELEDVSGRRHRARVLRQDADGRSFDEVGRADG